MYLLENIKRVEHITLEAFNRDFVECRQPVIIEGLFRNTPLEQLSNLEVARSKLGSMQLTLGEEFGTTMLKEMGIFPSLASESEDSFQSCNLDEYLSFIARNPHTRKMASVNEVPSLLRQILPSPVLCMGSNSREPLMRLFVGNAGNRAHLHFDTDGRDVLLCQIFGRKRVVIISEEQTPKLSPVRNFSGVFLEHFSVSDLKPFLDYTNAQEAILQPGDAVFIPKASWHYIEYIDTGMSVGFRFIHQDNQYLSFLVKNIYPNLYWQGLVSRFADEQTVREKYLADFMKIAVARLYPYKTAQECYEAVHSVVRETYRNLCLKGEEKLYMLSNLEEFESSLFSKLSYYHPQENLWLTEDAPFSARELQIDHLKGLLEKSPQQKQCFTLTLKECFGKDKIEELSKEEASALSSALKLL
ncbi:cupin-like domain-containing protein [Microcoleus sp. N9_A1]|uniref:cupin-like domain-containing protein n=1 Tax=Microcoleus sp. N9_A1 TaxID=3055380 RepID=UPI002FD3BFCE